LAWHGHGTATHVTALENRQIRKDFESSNLSLSATKIKMGLLGSILIFERAGCVDELTEFDNPAASLGWTTRTRRSGAKRRIRGGAANNLTLSATFNAVQTLYRNDIGELFPKESL
jgi:hypothetical protein